MLKMVTACTNVGAPKSICTHVSDTLPGDVDWYGPAVSAVSVVDAWLLAYTVLLVNPFSLSAQ